MTFISYAQNFEDIMLWRALKHVKSGFYIDVGANDPVIDSVTQAFYERGWHGINVEPMHQYYEKLATERERDINLPVAVGDAAGEITFFDIPDTGLSTMDSAIAQGHAAAGHTVIEQHIQVLTLTEICNRHVSGNIHFLKIDVEGFEAAVLRGMDFQKWRPWVLVIEATRPQTQVTSYDEWENMVLGADYSPAYFDGLNQYYVAREHAELIQAFKTPPNFFDDFRLRSGHYYSYPLTEFEARVHQAELLAQQSEAHAQQSEAHARRANSRAEQAEKRAHQADNKARQAEAEAQQAQARAQQAEMHAQQAQAWGENLERHLAVMYASTSWKVTRPLRGLKQIIRDPVEGGRKAFSMLPSPKPLAKAIIVRSWRYLASQEQVRASIVWTLGRFPALDTKIRAFAFRVMEKPVVPTPEQPRFETPEDLKKLSASARKVFANIERAADRWNR